MKVTNEQIALLVGVGAGIAALFLFSKVEAVSTNIIYRSPDPEPQVPKTLGDYLEESLRTAPIRLPTINVKVPPPPEI